MKNYNLLIPILILVISNSAFSQKFVSENKLWSNVEYGSEEGSPYNSYYIKFSADTVINDVVYKLIWQSEDSLYQKWKIIGQVREDDSGKVFTYNSSSNSEELLYDFGLNTGDSISTFGGYVYVDSVRFGRFGDSENSYKFIYMAPDITWIESVGSLNGVLNGISTIGYVGAYSSLVCYTEDGNLIYHNEEFNSCFPQEQYNSIANPGHGSPSVITVLTKYPDVVLIFSEMNTSDASIRVFDLNGRLMDQTFLHGEKQIQLPVNSYKSGLYFYLFQSKYETLSGKFVVIHE